MEAFAVFGPHPSGAKVAQYALQLWNREIEKELGVANVFTTTNNATIEAAEQIFNHPKIALICVTGGAAVAKAAAKSGKLVRGHTLIWNDNAPEWLKRLSAREVERVFDRHIEVVVARYAGKLHSWDVVNEPFWPMDGEQGGWRAGPWFRDGSGRGVHHESREA